MGSWGTGSSPSHPDCGVTGHEPGPGPDRPGLALAHHWGGTGCDAGAGAGAGGGACDHLAKALGLREWQ